MVYIVFVSAFIGSIIGTIAGIYLFLPRPKVVIEGEKPIIKLPALKKEAVQKPVIDSYKQWLYHPHQEVE